MHTHANLPVRSVVLVSIGLHEARFGGHVPGIIYRRWVAPAALSPRLRR